MDFEEHYTPEQEAFRAAVRGWMEARLPGNIYVPPDEKPLDQETQARLREFRRSLGAQGWLAPAWPTEAGGAGLSPALTVIIQEEIRRLHLPSLGDNPRWIPSIMTWGTDEQKRRYIPPAVRGELITWLCFTEADSGTDMAAIQTQAVREGDDYLINGAKAFITGQFDPDYLWTLAVTDPRRPQRLNLGVFMIDARSPGITIRTQRLLRGSERFVFFDNVRVSSDCLVGTPYLGWEIAMGSVAGEHGEPPPRVDERGTVASIIQYLKEEREGKNPNRS
ncbi:MAG: hypothetical protein EXR55_05835 [Dehalococcoidia bacterium]|nr:hypothetical protein [Dehalococcoidia bacterium]